MSTDLMVIGRAKSSDGVLNVIVGVPASGFPQLLQSGIVQAVDLHGAGVPIRLALFAGLTRDECLARIEAMCKGVPELDHRLQAPDAAAEGEPIAEVKHGNKIPCPEP